MSAPLDGLEEPPVLLCDLDGTLVDSLPDLAAAIAELLEAEGRPGLSHEAIAAMVGDGVPKLIERALAATGGVPAEAELAAMVARYMPIYEARLTELTRPYPGAIETLKALKAAGWRLAVCTNKPEAPSRAILAGLGFDGLFEAVVSYATRQPGRATGKSQFWLGAAAGGLLAAGVVFAVLALGIFNAPPGNGNAMAAVAMALGEQQEVSIAIDAERDLPNTTVNVVLYGGFEIVGFGEQRELTWNTDLEKGVNKLTLPLSAVEAASGEVVVRLEHEGTHREFRIELNITG